MDSARLRKQLNEYLYVEFGDSWDEPRNQIAVDWPYELAYLGEWAIPNAVDANDSVDVYLVHEEGKSQKSSPDLYVFATKHAMGADKVRGRSVTQYIQEEWDVEPKRLDEEKKE